MIKVIIRTYKILVSKFFYKEKPVVGCIYRRQMSCGNHPYSYIDSKVIEISKGYVDYEHVSYNGRSTEHLILSESVKYFMSVYSKITDVETITLSDEINNLAGVE